VHALSQRYAMAPRDQRAALTTEIAAVEAALVAAQG